MGGSLTQTLGHGVRAGSRALGFTLRKPGAAWLLARMAFWVLALSLLVKWLPLPRVMGLMRPRRRPRQPRAAQAEVQAGLAEMLDMLLRTNFWVFTPTCWKRAPVLYRYLALNGIETRVVFGMRREDEGALAGHAWLEAGGQPVLETSDPAYTATYVFPPAAES